MAVELVELASLPELTDPRWQSWLTPAELAYCTSRSRPGEHAGARLAAKRAAAELVGGDVTGLEIGRLASGAPVLRGAPVRVSMSHAAGYAAALAWST